MIYICVALFFLTVIIILLYWIFKPEKSIAEIQMELRREETDKDIERLINKINKNNKSIEAINDKDIKKDVDRLNSILRTTRILNGK